MPLKAGHSHEVIQDNITELVRSGRNPKQAVAMAIAEAQKHKGMASGGLVESEAGEGIHTKEALAGALSETNEERVESAIEPAAQPSIQVLSEATKNAIMDKKKKRVFA